ncbi:hypothetical protein ACFFRR_004763 [Megaselia abdita]
MECVICKEDMLVKGHGACIPCGHIFHLDCLGPWLAGNSNCPICRREFTTKSMQLLFLPGSIEDEGEVKLQPEDISDMTWKPVTISEHILENGALEYPIHPPRQNEEGNDRISRPVLITRLNPSSEFNSTNQLTGRRRYNDIPESNSCHTNCLRDNRKCFYISLLIFFIGITCLIIGLNLSKT